MAAPSGPAIDGIEIVRLIATTRTGEVWLGRDVAFDRNVAVKLLVAGDLRVEMLQREARSLARLSLHPHIVTIFRMGLDAAGRPLLILQYADGGALDARLDTNPTSWAELAPMLTMLLDALGSVHAGGYVHGDVKPANLLLDSSSGLLLADLGLAHASPRDDVRGMSLPYVAPEILRGEPHSTASDIYAVGVTCFEALTGHLPLDNADVGHPLQLARRAACEDIPRLPPDVAPRYVVDLIERFTAREPAERPTAIAALAALGDAGVTVDHVDLSSRVSARSDRPPARRRLTIAVAIVVAAIGAFAVSAAVWRDAEPDGPSEPSTTGVEAGAPGSTARSSGETDNSTHDPDEVSSGEMPADEDLADGVTGALSGAEGAGSGGPVDMQEPGDNATTVPTANTSAPLAEPTTWSIASRDAGQFRVTRIEYLVDGVPAQPLTPDVTDDHVIVAWETGPDDGLVSLHDPDTAEALAVTSTSGRPSDAPTLLGGIAWVPLAIDGGRGFGIAWLDGDALQWAVVERIEDSGEVSLDSNTPVIVAFSDQFGPVLFAKARDRYDTRADTIDVLFPTDLLPATGAIWRADSSSTTLALDTAAATIVVSGTDMPTISHVVGGSHAEVRLLTQTTLDFDTIEFLPQATCCMRSLDGSIRLQRVVHPAPDGTLWLATRDRKVVHVDADAAELAIVDAGPCPVTDVVVGCDLLPEQAEGVFAHDAFWLGNPADGALYRVDSSHQVTDVIPVGERPGIPIATEDAIWIADLAFGSIVRIDALTREVTAQLELPCETPCGDWSEGTEWRRRPVANGSTLWLPWDDALFRIETAQTGPPAFVDVGPDPAGLRKMIEAWTASRASHDDDGRP